MHFTIYGTPVCPYCSQAKQLLLSKGHSFNYVDLTAPGAPSQQEIQSMAGQPVRTVPQIFQEGFERKYIGGFEQLREYLRNAEAT